MLKITITTNKADDIVDALDRLAVDIQAGPSRMYEGYEFHIVKEDELILVAQQEPDEE